MTEPFVFSSPADAIAGIGAKLGPAAGRSWIRSIDIFAEATGDHQRIHVDPARARTGPFGTTIAHGYLTFSLINMLLPELCAPTA